MKRNGRSVESLAGVSVEGMRCFVSCTIFLLSRLVLRPDLGELLGVACGPRRAEPAAGFVIRPTRPAPVAPPPSPSPSPPLETAASPTKAAVSGSAERKKINTVQAAKPHCDATNQRKKSGGRDSDQGERELIAAQRLRVILGETDDEEGSAPDDEQLDAAEAARRAANLADPPAPGLMRPIPLAVLDACLPKSVALRPHQLGAVRYLLTHRGLVIYHSVGSGKTQIAAVAARCVLTADRRARVIFVSPKSLITNFQRTLGDARGDPADLIARVTCYTYEKFALDYARGLVDAAGTFLIVDEAHRLRSLIKDKNPFRCTGRIKKPKTAECMLKCACKAGKVLLLTATPVVNDPLDYVNLVAMLRGDVVPIGVRDFHKRLFSRKGEVVDPVVLGSFLADTASIYVRPLDGDYPAVEEHRVEIPMSNAYLREYLRVEKAALTPHQREVLGPNDLEAFYNGIRRTVNADIDELNAKLTWVRDNVLSRGVRKMVIFSPFISLGVRQLEQLLADFKVKPHIGSVEGSDCLAARQAAIDDYNAGRVQILIVSVLAGGLGINLMETRDVVIMQPGWNDVEVQQAVGRAVRFKSHNRLPPDQRRVDVWRLLLVKPRAPGTKPKPGWTLDETAWHRIREMSADLIIEEIAQRKSRLLAIFSAILSRCNGEKRP